MMTTKETTNDDCDRWPPMMDDGHHWGIVHHSHHWRSSLLVWRSSLAGHQIDGHHSESSFTVIIHSHHWRTSFTVVMTTIVQSHHWRSSFKVIIDDHQSHHWRTSFTVVIIHSRHWRPSFKAIINGHHSKSSLTGHHWRPSKSSLADIILSHWRSPFKSSLTTIIQSHHWQGIIHSRWRSIHSIWGSIHSHWRSSFTVIIDDHHSKSAFGASLAVIRFTVVIDHHSQSSLAVQRRLWMMAGPPMMTVNDARQWWLWMMIVNDDWPSMTTLNVLGNDDFEWWPNDDCEWWSMTTVTDARQWWPKCWL
jgi:hypothetical protein